MAAGLQGQQLQQVEQIVHYSLEARTHALELADSTATELAARDTATSKVKAELEDAVAAVSQAREDKARVLAELKALHTGHEQAVSRHRVELERASQEAEAARQELESAEKEASGGRQQLQQLEAELESTQKELARAHEEAQEETERQQGLLSELQGAISKQDGMLRALASKEEAIQSLEACCSK